MNRHRFFTVAAALAALGCIAATKVDYVYGPQPDWDDYKRLGEIAIRAKLPDPVGWQVEWPNGYIKTGWYHGGSFPGYMTCGVVRAIQPVAHGYAMYPFAVVIDHGAVKTVDFDPRKSGRANFICAQGIAQGNLPPASMMPVAAPSTTIASLGLSIRPMSEGAYVTDTIAGSPAATAGVANGMVITRANGIALAGMGPAMVKILQSHAATITLDTATGQHITLNHP